MPMTLLRPFVKSTDQNQKSNTQDIDERMRVAMRTAIRQDKRSKLWAKANCEDNFASVVRSIACSAAMDIVVAEIDTREMTDWANRMLVNEQAGLNKLALTVCREMYSILRT